MRRGRGLHEPQVMSPALTRDTGRTRTAVPRFAGARLAARPRCQSPREESNLCARGRSPLLLSAELRRRVVGAGGGSRTPMGRGPPASEAGASSLFRHARTRRRYLNSSVSARPLQLGACVLRCSVHAAGRLGCDSGRISSSRACRRASSEMTLAGRTASAAAVPPPGADADASRLLSCVEGRLAAPLISQRAPRAKSEMSCGVAVSKPTTSSIP